MKVYKSESFVFDFTQGAGGSSFSVTEVIKPASTRCVLSSFSMVSLCRSSSGPYTNPAGTNLSFVPRVDFLDSNLNLVFQAISTMMAGEIGLAGGQGFGINSFASIPGKGILFDNGLTARYSAPTNQSTQAVYHILNLVIN
jgi:hypothetical protein